MPNLQRFLCGGRGQKSNAQRHSVGTSTRGSHEYFRLKRDRNRDKPHAVGLTRVRRYSRNFNCKAMLSLGNLYNFILTSETFL